jgi:hypothetical protein
LILKPGTGIGPISNQEPHFQERKILKPGIRNLKIMNLKPGTKIVKNYIFYHEKKNTRKTLKKYFSS